MSQTAEVQGKYAIAEPWRPITESDGLKLGPRVQEAFIEALESGPDLVYYRQQPHADWMPLYTIVAKRKQKGETATFSIGDTNKVDGLDLIAMMIDGKIAHCAVLEAQLVFLGNKGRVLREYLSRKAETLGGLSSYFSEVPSTGKHLEQEVETLRKLDKARTKLNAGKLSKDDLRLFGVYK